MSNSKKDLVANIIHEMDETRQNMAVGSGADTGTTSEAPKKPKDKSKEKKESKDKNKETSAPKESKDSKTRSKSSQRKTDKGDCAAADKAVSAKPADKDKSVDKNQHDNPSVATNVTADTSSPGISVQNMQPLPGSTAAVQDGLLAYLATVQKQNEKLTSTVTALSEQMLGLARRANNLTGQTMSDSEDDGEEGEQDALMQEMEDYIHNGPSDNPPDGKDDKNESLEGSSSSKVSKDLVEEATAQFKTVETDSAIDVKMATLMEKMVLNPLDEKICKDLIDAKKRPENCPHLVTPRVNEDLWKRRQLINDNTKTQDVKLQNVQKRLVAGIIPIVYAADKLYTAKEGLSEDDTLACLKLILEGLPLLTSAGHEVNNRRKDLLRQNLPEHFAHLCNYNRPVTTELLGDDLTKTIRDLKGTSTLMN